MKAGAYQEGSYSEINFRFGEKSKVQPKNMEALTPDMDVTVILKGSIKSFSAGEPWDQSKRFSLAMTSCEIVLPDSDREDSLDAALKAAKTTLKKVK